jgi:SAM-dependent methyltransferase
MCKSYPIPTAAMGAMEIVRHPSFYDEVYYDGHGKSYYDGYNIESSPFEQHADVIVRYMRAFDLAGSVLDVGCAKGYLVSILRKRGIEAFGVDWSPYAIPKASPDVKRYLFRASAMELPFASKEFALVVTHDVLEHLDRPSAQAALQECARVSRRQLHQVNTGRLEEWVYDHDESHVLKLSLSEWQEMVESLSIGETTTIREPNDGSPVPGSAPS